MVKYISLIQLIEAAPMLGFQRFLPFIGCRRSVSVHAGAVGFVTL